MSTPPVAPEASSRAWQPGPARGRGAERNPASRFDRLRYEEADPPAPDEAAAEARGPRTLFFRDPARSLIARNESPDVGFSASINPYRGCEHGCVYCYARPTHEYLGFSAGLDFETRILVKERAPELLRAELAARRWQPQVLGLAGVTDAYQPVERRLRLTRRCLEVLSDVRNPVAVVTKNALVARDRDVLAALAEQGAALVQLSITSLDADLQRRLEPRASHPEQRLRAIAQLAEADIPVGVMVAPVIPGLNDHELPAILEAAAGAGAGFAAWLMLRLPHGLPALLDGWLEQHAPERRARVWARIREVRGGELSDARFGSRHRGEGLYARQIGALFDVTRRRLGIAARPPALSVGGFRRPGDRQLRLL